MNILLVGDVYSKSGRDAISKYLKDIIIKEKIDFTIVNGENISHGKGINKNHYTFLKKMGVDVITSGNHIFKSSDTVDFIDNVDDLLRPANMNSYLPGKGSNVYKAKEKKIRVTNLMGKTYMEHVNNPYESMDKILSEDNSDIHIVDFHGEASAEKIAFAWNYDGKIDVLVGTHTHVQTADERILNKGTAFITDMGMTGAYDSIIGANPEEVIKKEKLGIPTKFVPSTNEGMLNGVIVYFNENNQPTSIKRVFKYNEHKK